MTGGVNTQHDTRIRAGAMGLARQPPNRTIGHADRHPDARAGDIQAVADAERLVFLGGRYIGGRETRRRGRAEFKWEMSGRIMVLLGRGRSSSGNQNRKGRNTS